MLGANQMAVIPMLEGLCGQDETVVREMAVKSLVSIMTNASDADINAFITPMVDHISPRSSGSQLTRLTSPADWPQPTLCVRCTNGLEQANSGYGSKD